jgi:hypothetical protein
LLEGNYHTQDNAVIVITKATSVLHLINLKKKLFYTKVQLNMPTETKIDCETKNHLSLSEASIQSVPELAPQRKQACADNKRDSKLTKINFLLAQITEL